MKDVKRNFNLTIKEYLQELKSKGIIKDFKTITEDKSNFHYHFTYKDVCYSLLKNHYATDNKIELYSTELEDVQFLPTNNIDFIENFYNTLERVNKEIESLNFLDLEIQQGFAENCFCDNYGFCGGSSCKNYHNCKM